MVPNLMDEETDRNRAYQISFMGQSRQTNISYEEEFGDIIKNQRNKHSQNRISEYRWFFNDC